MRVVAAYSWARDVTGAVVGADGAVEWRRGRMAPGEHDHAVVAIARALAGQDGEAVGLTVGDADPSWALARGLGEAWRVTGVPALVDQSRVAAALAAGVRRIGAVEVVVVADDDEHPLVGAAVAADLGWPAVVGVTQAEVRDGRVEAVRRVGDAEETVSVSMPAVVVAAATGNETRPPGMKEMLTARKRPVTDVDAAALGVDVTDPVAVVATRRPETTSAQLFTGDPADAARRLVAALRTEGVL